MNVKDITLSGVAVLSSVASPILAQASQETAAVERVQEKQKAVAELEGDSTNVIIAVLATATALVGILLLPDSDGEEIEVPDIDQPTNP
ncbi:hypothetical protein [Sphingorhabdus sp. Alg239-R122]|uniref:hypothetical protein n=1 Tax=Sphingorhabdus sp. Alg239-R122 TaxID=2305989 RepID=UPI0013D971F0|nr:hypothetical protein [Sphingorhabdus sp. Alg239-R122]